ncbi:DNA-directed RNA polymerase I subunit RPA43-like [Odontomachus brunneus]|uniref:DNA-directed RNA polymerase I subunit RPA43-like n=1 Tax=Odontomachus brunneus TaxID=486640 RepID=UPI0013F1E7F1|nr:DNA-directed RNA polymerase I subunit RPA43-like [Odontomachus brunneus]
MRFKTYQRIIWTNLELMGLLEEDDSCVHFKNTTKHLALHPFHLKNLRKALNEILMSMLNTYDAELKGFLISYKNPKLLSNSGEIFYDSHFIHVDIEADFYLFCPKVGSSLKGIVNKKGLDHIVLLVHKVFTVTIPKPDNEEEEWLGNTVEIGQEIKCSVTHIDKNAKIPFICATLNTDYLQNCRLPEIFNISDTGINIKNNINGMKMINGSNVTTSEDNDKETHIKIKIEHSDSEAYTQKNIGSNYKLQNNDDTDLYNNTNPTEHMESRKRKKRERSETDTTSEPEKKKKKKHVKKSRESDSESMYMTENEESIFNNTTNTVHSIKCPKEEQQNSKKHKKSKKVSMIMSDSEPEDYVIKIKEEKPDPVILDKLINENMGISSSNKNMEIQNLDEHMKSDLCIKIEDSEKDKRKSKKHKKTHRNSESEIKIKSEGKIINISPVKKHYNEDEEQLQHTEHMSASNISSSISDHEDVSKKQKKKSKTPASPDSKSKQYIKIEEVDN